MNAELLAMLGGQMPPSASSRNRENEGKTVLSFKAGKMKTELQPNGKYLVTPDNRRGQIKLVWQAQSSSGSGSGSGGGSGGGAGGVLKFEWVDRRTRAVVDSLTIFSEDECTYSKVPTGRDGDRVYLLQYGRASDRRFFFWMQDKDKEGGPEKDAEKDEENCVKVNSFIADPAEAAKVAREAGGEAGSSGGDATGGGGGGAGAGLDTSALGGGALDNAALMQIMQGLGGSGGGTSGSASRPAAGGSGSGSGASGSGGAVQADALSNILQNLGAGSGGASGGAETSGSGDGAGESGSGDSGGGGGEESSGSAPASSSSAAAGGRTLTLADLQGAMAGLATTSPPHSGAASLAAAASPPGPPLSELVTPDAVAESGILDDPDVRKRLIELLPEGQRTEEMLQENLRSPQVAQCLKSLTAALAGEGGGEFNSIIANFQLKPEDGAAALASGNPIQAFLDCILKSVEREKVEKGEGKEETKEEGKDDDKMEEGD